MAARPDRIVLDSDKLIATIDALAQRIAVRFPGSGLANLSSNLLNASRSAVVRGRAIQRPRPVLRTISALLLLAMAGLLAYAILRSRPPSGTMDAFEIVQGIEATLSGIVLLGAIALFVITLEGRLKRKKALEALHELRVLAHVIDLHQIEKDPGRSFEPSKAGESRAPLDPLELDHYLNYCCDLLALVGKVAAYYLQSFQDEVVLGAVNEIEDLSNGLTRKIWQKLMLLDQL